MFFSDIETDDDRDMVIDLYNKYKNLMYKVSYDILRDKSLAEDAVQSSFIKIIKSLQKINKISSPKIKNYLVIISRNVSINMLNESKKLITVSENPDEIHSGGSGLDDIILRRESVSKIAEAIKSLKPIYRDTLLLKRVYGYSDAEIAELTGVSEETARKRLMRARNKIIEYVKREEDNNDD